MKLKKILSTILVMALVVTGIQFGNTQNVEAKSKKYNYSKVFSEYRKAIKNNYYADDNFENISKYLNLELLLSSSYYDSFNVYYVLKDLNGDGVKELIIDAADKKKNLGKDVYDVFTYRNGKVVRLLRNQFEFGYRMQLTINTKNTLCVLSTGGAQTTAYYYYKLNKKTSKPKMVKHVLYDYGKYYQVSKSGKKKEISEKKYNAIVKKYEGKARKFKWKKLK